MTCDFCEGDEDNAKCFLADLDYTNEAPFAPEGEQCRICEGCTSEWAGQILESPAGVDYRLVVEHDNYEQAKHCLVDVVKNMNCHSCGKRLGTNADERFDFARKMLRIQPDAFLNEDGEFTWFWTCEVCANDEKCDHCENDHDGDDDNGWVDNGWDDGGV